MTTQLARYAAPRHRFVARVPLLAALLVATATTALAHDTWLLPASLRVPVGRAVQLSLTSGMAFPKDDFAIRPERVRRADARLGGRVTLFGTAASAPASLRYRWTPNVAGVATLVVELAPRTLELTPDKIAEYFDEIDASPELRATWARMPSPKRWRESYTKHAVSFVRVGAPDADSSWRAPLGMGLEIVPERDPTALIAGASLPVRVLRAGAPAAGFVVGARHESATGATFVRTGADGRAIVALPRAGRWLLNGTDLRRTTAPGLTWRSDFATVTLAVAPR